MEIRTFHESDIHGIVALFYETVHTVNKKDYTQEQLDAWASKADEELRLKSWKEAMLKNLTYVALNDGQIVGFSDMTREGYLDRLFVHKDFQGRGIASSLVEALETEAETLGIHQLETHASMTAKPFFEHRGYRLVQSQCVERRGVQLVNFKMIKKLR